jgi:RNA polymerase sigma-70 factor, ECF subfamily
MVELSSGENGPNESAGATQNPHAEYVTKIEREQVRVAIKKLPVEYSETIILREYEELSYQEIAGVLGCPPGTVMSRLARARARIREALAPSLTAPVNGKHGKG